jgi:anti-anti-sigma factor
MTELAAVEIIGGHDGIVRGRITGELDAASAPVVRARVEAALATEGSHVVLDLSPVTFMDSAGVELIFRLREQLVTRDMRLTLVVPADALIRRTLEVTDGGDQLLEIVETAAAPERA